MLLKMGVSIFGLQKPITSKFDDIEAIWRTWGEEPVITSGTEGTHSITSLHGPGYAIDLRFPKNRSASEAVVALKTRLGRNYDVVIEKDHIHVEYDPE